MLVRNACLAAGNEGVSMRGFELDDRREKKKSERTPETVWDSTAI